MFIPLRDDNPTSRVPLVTIALIAVNTAVFLSQASLPHGLEQAALRFGAVPYAITHFRALAGTAAFPPLLPSSDAASERVSSSSSASST